MSKEVTLPNYDKSKWIHGEWDNEPDRVDFIHSGFSCFILRNSHGNWCGYVGVPSTHSCYKKDYDEVDVHVHVHGGLTYAAVCAHSICHIPEQGMPDEVWWLGFDTAHWNDISPSRDLNIMAGDTATYKNVEYVRKETEELAEQLNKL